MVASATSLAELGRGLPGAVERPVIATPVPMIRWRGLVEGPIGAAVQATVRLQDPSGSLACRHVQSLPHDDGPGRGARWFGASSMQVGNAAAEVYPGYPGLVFTRGELRSMVWGFPLALKGKSGQPLKPRPVNNRL